jgi:hypothetical protein
MKLENAYISIRYANIVTDDNHDTYLVGHDGKKKVRFRLRETQNGAKYFIHKGQRIHLSDLTKSPR